MLEKLVRNVVDDITRCFPSLR